MFYFFGNQIICSLAIAITKTLKLVCGGFVLAFCCLRSRSPFLKIMSDH